MTHARCEETCRGVALGHNSMTLSQISVPNAAPLQEFKHYTLDVTLKFGIPNPTRLLMISGTEQQNAL